MKFKPSSPISFQWLEIDNNCLYTIEQRCWEILREQKEEEQVEDEIPQPQSEHDEFEAKFFEERAALEAKYQKLYAPLYAKRYDIVNRVVEVDGANDEAAMDVTGDKGKEEKGVPNFWLNAMKTNEILAEELPLPYLKVGYLTTPPMENPLAPHCDWKRFHEGLQQVHDDEGKTNDRPAIKVDILDDISVV
ncbi:hypothetical protein SSX86_007615 [Deinandra increscens subsp. villosa]|uniref:Uncharacterized protein n=1 Tax=Deinandra increscens subsp. villosa TaxID=3103831 RepID=A0AAP0H5X2_9ASTR